MWVFRKVTQNDGVLFEFNILKYIITTFFVFYSIKLFKKSNVDLFPKLLLGLVLIIDFIPSSIFYTSLTDEGFEIYFFHIVLFYSFMLVSKYKIKIGIPVLNKKQSFLLIFFIAFLCLLPFLRYAKYINLNNLLLQDIYITRAHIKESFDTYSGYTHSWLSRIIIPIIFVFCLIYKQVSLAIINFLFLIFLFLIGAMKSVLLGSIMVLVFYFIKKEKMFTFVIKGLILSCLLALVILLFIDHPGANRFAAILHRRLLFVPSLLDYCYFSYFEDNYLYWSNSFLARVVEYPYDVSTPYLIGERYFSIKTMAANNGLISDGFSNFGYLGILINILFFNVYMLIINSCRIDLRFFGIFFIIFYAFLTTQVSTVLITHGAMLLLFLSVILLRQKNP